MSINSVGFYVTYNDNISMKRKEKNKIFKLTEEIL